MSLVGHCLLDLPLYDTKLAKRSSYLVPLCSCQSCLNCHKMPSEGRVLGQNPVPRSGSMENLYLLKRGDRRRDGSDRIQVGDPLLYLLSRVAGACSAAFLALSTAQIVRAKPAKLARSPQ